MILKDKSSINATSATAKAGLKQEQDVAFYLRRSFKDHEQVLVFNDLKFCYNDETAQIDHLILYPYGFILIESKSITGEVAVNKQQEWSRSYQGKWQGMPSPIKQVELQQALLRDLMFQHRDKILGKSLFQQQSFGGRCWHNVCAISSNAIIDRSEMPADISEQLVKSEFLVDKLKKIMKLRHKIINKLNFIDTRPNFSADEMASISDFLLSQDISNGKQPTALINENPTEPNVVSEIKDTPKIELPATKSNAINLCCSKCQATTQLVPSHGKYGYYLKCQQCSGNTAMKLPCPHCNSKQAKVSKRKNNYSLNCTDCDQQTKYEIS
ncbi:MAG: NERD domain-containing protein [Gammaproteobacteria bacterium]|nr:NERD domain-containing protein [Gammaproteobacteria bacterium]